jgi:phenylpyruvate tautomerase PptA (4-oxalocrotonate tautomerase family)/ketosteroid isomerase-like protein
MPVIKVTLIEGYDDATIRTLSSRLTDAVRATIAAPLDGITVATEEVRPACYMRGGKSRTPGAPAPAATEIVRDFLARLEARDLTAARAHLGEGFEMVFPSGKRMRDLETLVEWSRHRYDRVAKRFDGFDVAFSGDAEIVWCRGTLSGAWTDGTPFDDIRFCDRFELKTGRITRQEVWNDLAEWRPR